MNLKKRIEFIVKKERCLKREIDFDEIENFVREHRNHGGYLIGLEYSEKNDLMQISVQCDAYNLNDFSYCLYQNEDTPLDLIKTIVYENGRYFDEPSEEDAEYQLKRKKEIEVKKRRDSFHIVK
jgi:hypothetical protein